MNYNRLENSLIDVIKEEQAKLGYMKEKISLYYPLSSLNHFFGNKTDAAGMIEILKDFPSYIEEKFGEVAVSHRGDRFCFTVSEKASEYVHNNMKENEFIKALIELVGRHGCTIEEIKELFHSYSDKIITEPMDNEEFDVMIRFDDGSDPYYYCFKDEGCHIIYHRFLPGRLCEFWILIRMSEKFSNCRISKNICDICNKSMLFFCQISTKISRNSILTDSLNNGNFYLI